MQSLPRFHLSNPEAGSDSGDSIYFTGEMVSSVQDTPGP